MKFKGVREMGYRNFEQVMDPSDVVKFGKKVDYDAKMSSDLVMQDHLRQIRENVESGKLNLAIQRRQEREYLANIKQLDELE